MSDLHYENGALHLDGVGLERLAADCGTPLYVYSRRTIEERYRNLDAAFRGLPHRILYSVKANSSLGVLAVLARLGAGADVVSGGELSRALRAGIAADRIVFAGAGKTDAELELALASRISLINVESRGEFERLAPLAERLGVPAQVALRITPEIVGGTHDYTETGTAETKFGMPVEDALDLARRERHRSPLQVVGLHVHFGSQITTIEPFVESARRLRHAVGLFRAEGIDIKVLNLGGGLGIRYNEEEPPAPLDLARGLRPILSDLGVEAWLEPGRYLVGPAGYLVARVVDVKTTGRRTFCVVDAAMNDLIRPSLYGAYHDVVPVRPAAGELVEIDLVGPVCESGDFLARRRLLPPLQPGHLVVIKDVGAYGFSMSSNYNSRPRAAEALLENGGWRVIRARETIDDLMRGETV